MGEKEDEAKRGREAHKEIAKANDYIYDEKEDKSYIRVGVGYDKEGITVPVAQAKYYPLSDEEFAKLKYEADMAEDEGPNEKLWDVYFNILEILRKYCDWKEEYYPIVAVWIIGTYFHDKLLTYPYLYFNASKESGKSRSVKLITYMSKDGEMVNSMSEAVLFRTKGTLGIDEFERASRKGSENLLELLNSAYKKGARVKRMKKVKTDKGEEQQVENFEVFRPIVLANIWGMDTVLEDRTLPMYLEKTSRPEVSNLLEIWEFDKKLHDTLKILKEECSLCSVVSLQKVYVDWNEYAIINYITTGTNNYTNYRKGYLFDKIKNSGIKGRMLELSLPLIIISDMIREDITDTLIQSLKMIYAEKSQEAFLENKDIILVDMVSCEPTPTYFQSVKTLAEKFRQFGQFSDKEEWINEKWVGRALKRTLLVKEKKRTNRGIEILLDVEKAQEKMKMFK